MRLVLHDLCSLHPALRGYPIDLFKYGGLALQRAGHTSPVRAGIDHNGLGSMEETAGRSLPADRLAIVIAFDRPLIMAGST